MQLSQHTLHVLALLADAYTPILLCIALIEVARTWIAGNKLHAAQLAYATVLVYVLMFIDKYFQLWASFGLDYSTHSAAAFALVVVISMGKSLPYKLALAVSLVAYGCLMKLLNYHGWGDMLTTVFVLGVGLFPVLRLSRSAKTSLSIL